MRITVTKMIDKIIAMWETGRDFTLEDYARETGVSIDALGPILKAAALEQVARAVEKWRV